LDFSDAAYCKARARLPFGFFRRLQRAVTGRCFEDDRLLPQEQWHGHDVYLIDGSSFSMPDTPELQEAFGQPSGQAAGVGFPSAHLLLSCQAATGYIRDFVTAPVYTHDLTQVAALHRTLRQDAVLVGDRAFCSYAHLACCRQRQLHAVFRAHQKSIIDFRPHRRYAPPELPAQAARGLPRSRWLRRLGKHDQWVEYYKPKQRPAWMTPEQFAALPATFVVRELHYRIPLPGRRTQQVTLVTTLLDPQRYSKHALATLYGLRWEVETHLRQLKQTLGMDILHCRSFVGVMKELTMFITVYNLVRRVMRQAALQQDVAVNRISFIDALRWLAQARPGEAVPHFKVIPLRPGRMEPRVRKRRPKQYSLMRKPRWQLQQELLKGVVA